MFSVAAAAVVSKLVRLHLAEPHDCILALCAVIVRLPSIMWTLRGGGAAAVALLLVVGGCDADALLSGGVLLEAGGRDGVHLLVLPAVRHHLVGVGAVVLAFQAVEV